MKNNEKPCMFLIEETNDILRERYWIIYYTEVGCNLVNSSLGCESHAEYIVPQFIKDALSKARKGNHISDCHKEALIKSNTGRRMPNHVKEILLEYSHARKNSATHCRNGHEYTEENITPAWLYLPMVKATGEIKE